MFLNAILDNKLIDKQSLTKAQTETLPGSNYGLGWQIARRDSNETVFMHSGGASGFRSLMAYIPSKRKCVILLNNHENADLHFLADKIFDILDGMNVVHPSEVMLQREQLLSLVGTFETTGEAFMMIRTSVLDDRLAMQFDGQPKTVLLAQDGTTFLHPEANARVLFQNDDTSGGLKLTIERQATVLTAKRVDAKWES